MPFFTQDQKLALDRLHLSHPQHGELLEFLGGPFDRFLTDRIAPFAAQQDEEEWFDEAAFRALGDTGFLGLPFGEDVGGLAAPFSYLMAGLESLAKANAGFALGVAIHGTCTDGLYRFAGEELKQRYVPDLLAARRIGCFGLTEPDSGSDAKALRTTFREEDDAFVLSGSKYWITNGPSADVFFIMARDARDGGISAFAVERGWPGGFDVQPIKEKMGVRGSNTAMLVFESYRVPKSQLIGERGRGFSYAMHMLNGGRITIGAWSTGVAQGAYEKILKYAHERRLFGKRLLDLDNTKRELSQMLIGLHAGRMLSYSAAFDKSRGLDVAREAAIAKVAASEHAVFCGQRAVELGGGYGYARESRIERHLRDALLARIGEGANELLEIMVIPRAIERQYETEGTPDLW